VSCTTCRTTFAALAGTDKKEHALRLDQEEPTCRCQRVSVSAHSPGPVDDTETLIRIVIVPHHVGKMGSLKASVLTHTENIGMSVFREERATDDEIRATATTLVQNARKAMPAKPVGVLGLLRMKCAEIRTFCWEPETDPCYCVYDTAKEEAPAHADAFQRIANVPEEVRLARRIALFDRVKAHLITVDEFRDGLLKDLAPGREA
jgi:hypothetical protein